MADCKTIVMRRNSRDSGLGNCPPGRSGGGPYQPNHPPPHHFPNNHYHHPRNGPRSMSYHHQQHYHPSHNPCHFYGPGGSQFQNGCGFMPPPPPMQLSDPCHQYNYGGNEHITPHQGLDMKYSHHNMEPPPRPWVQLANPKHKRICFSVLCYNILCSQYASKSLYSYCPNWALDWNYRRKAILQELVHYAADIISLQELETDQFYNYFLPQLEMLGYSGVFACKSRARTMAESKRKHVDGCAIFYKTSKFRLLSEHVIEFSQIAISNATKSKKWSEDMLNRVQTKDNIAIAALLEPKVDSTQTKGLRGLVTPKARPLLVSTCHIHWDPNYCDVKLVQTMMLMQELKKITDNIDWAELASQTASTNSTQPSKGKSDRPSSSAGSSSTSSTKNSIEEKVNLLVCGDFNSLPQSGVVEYMQEGTVSCAHPDFKGLRYEGYIDAVPIETSEDSDKSEESPPKEEFKHNFNLKSAYLPCAMPFTNYTLDFRGVIDYVFHSGRGLRALGVLGELDQAWLVQNNVVGAPHPFIPSDHLPLLVEFEMVPAI